MMKDQDTSKAKATTDQASDRWVLPLGVVSAAIVFAVVIFGSADNQSSTVASNSAPAQSSLPVKAPAR